MRSQGLEHEARFRWDPDGAVGAPLRPLVHDECFSARPARFGLQLAEDADRAAFEVDVLPDKAEELTLAHSEVHREREHRLEAVVLRSVEQCIFLRDIEVDALVGRHHDRLGQARDVARDHVLALGVGEGDGEDRADVVARGVRDLAT